MVSLKLEKFLKERSYEEIRLIARPNKIDWNAPTSIFSTRIALFFLKFGITPNQVTVFWTAMVSLSTIFLLFGNYFYNLIFVLLYIGFYTFDYVDGDMARIMRVALPKYKQNVLASWLDKSYYYIHRALVLIALACGAYFATSETYYLFLGIATVFFVLGDIMLKLRGIEVLVTKGKHSELVESEPKSKSKLVGWAIAFVRPDPISILTLALVLNVSNYMVFFYFFVFGINFFKSYSSIFNRMKKISR